MNDLDRLAAVNRYGVLDTPCDAAFDRITAAAARLLKTPMATISIVDRDRIWFKSRHGIGIGQVDREPGLCASCILHEGPWVISNARTDARALSNSLVKGEPGIQFYFGIPLRTHDGFNLGALSVLDVVPRTVTPEGVGQLQDLATLAMDRLENMLAIRTASARYYEERARSELREDYIRGLKRELAHRSRNLLALVSATARHTAPRDPVSMAYADALLGRVQGLANTLDLVVAASWRGAYLKELSAFQIEQFSKPGTTRVALAGPSVMLTPSAAQHIGMALHELASNARRFGALSCETGLVSFTWRFERRVSSQDWLHLNWSERYGPGVSQPSRRAFGHMVLERLVPDGLGGTATLVFAPTGLLWSCEAPAAFCVLSLSNGDH